MIESLTLQAQEESLMVFELKYEFKDSIRQNNHRIKTKRIKSSLLDSEILFSKVN